MKKEILALGLCMALGLCPLAKAQEEAPMPMFTPGNPQEEGPQLVGEVLAATRESLTLALGSVREEGFLLSGEEVTIPIGEETLWGVLPGEEPRMAEAGIGEENHVEPGDLVLVSLDEEGRALRVAPFQEGNLENAGAPVFPAGEEEEPIYEAVLSLTADEERKEQDIISRTADENAVHVSEGATVSLTDVNLERESEGDTGGEQARRYGVGAAALVTDGALLALGGSIRTEAISSAGVFAYGQGEVSLVDTDVHTVKEESPGICATSGGVLDATNLMVICDGENSASLYATEGSTLTVEGGSFLAKGSSSPAFLGGGKVSIRNAVVESQKAEALRLEENGEVLVEDATLVGNLSEEGSEEGQAVFLSQRIPREEQMEGISLCLQGGSLSAGQGGLFWITNTECSLELEGVTLIPSEKNPFFLRCTGNADGFGIAGNNGAFCVVTARGQECQGDVLWDSLGSLNLTLTENSTLTGAILQDETYAGAGGEGGCYLDIEEGSTWVVTGDSILTSLSGAGDIVDAEGNRVSIVGSDGSEYVQGEAGFVIVTDQYDPN